MPRPRGGVNFSAMTRAATSPLALFHPAVREWFQASFQAPTPPQTLGWPAIARGESTLILAPTGSGKTLAAFLRCLDRLMFSPEPPKRRALPRALRLAAQGAGGGRGAQPARAAGGHRAGGRRRAAMRIACPLVAVRTGDTPAAERARFRASPPDILITTPESLYLLLTSNAREVLRSVDTVIVDEIHALVPTKRGAHLALSLERLEALHRQAGCSASACPPPSARSTRWRASWAAPTSSPPGPAQGSARRRRPGWSGPPRARTRRRWPRWRWPPSPRSTTSSRDESAAVTHTGR